MEVEESGRARASEPGTEDEAGSTSGSESHDEPSGEEGNAGAGILKVRRDAVFAKTDEHLFDHRDFNPHCMDCVRAKTQHRPHKRGKLAAGPTPKRFGDYVTGDSLINRDAGDNDDDNYPGATNAFVMYDRATGWIECAPKGTLSYEDTLEAMRHTARR